MKKTLSLLLILLGVWAIVGCSDTSESATADASILREVAWNSLSDSAKDEVVGEWKDAKVEVVIPSNMPNVRAVGKEHDDTYQVTFNSTRDELLGPFVVYVDGSTQEILGQGARK